MIPVKSFRQSSMAFLRSLAVLGNFLSTKFKEFIDFLALAKNVSALLDAILVGGWLG
jgi:hypothetical protein